jgi:hypothetical protein
MIALFVLLMCAFARNAFAQAVTTENLSDGYFRASQGLSMAGAYRAIANSPSAIIYNPAGVALNKGKMQAQADYAYQGDVDSHLYGVGITDFQSSQQIAYGLSYHFTKPVVGGISADVNQTILAVGYTMGTMIQLGVSAKGYWVNIDSNVLQGPRGVDMDAGVIVRPIPILSFGLTGYNLVRGDTIEEFPLMLGIGGAVIFEPHAKLSFDYVNNFNTLSTNSSNYHMGAEVRVADSAYLRGGFVFDEVENNNYYAVGGAVTGPMADLMFTFSQRLSPSSETYAVSAAFKF